MKAVAIIPARYASTRFPGKPLAKETGKFLIQHVYERVLQAARVSQCIIATDDDRIRRAAESFGGHVRMTDPAHASGTDRVAEVVRGCESPGEAIFLNVQGDEPEIEPAYLDRLVTRLAEDPACGMATLACPFAAEIDPRDPNCVKVVTNRRGQALYFSRSLIPYPRDAAGEARLASDWLLHLGVYAYRRSFLLEFAGLPPGTLERAERLEQLRALEHGHAVGLEIVERSFTGIDTPGQYAAFVRRWSARRSAV